MPSLWGYLLGVAVRWTGAGLLIWQAVTGHGWALIVLLALIVAAVELLAISSPVINPRRYRR